jgi:DNA mismatch repair ATPase MutL
MNKRTLALLLGNAILDALNSQGLEVTVKEDGQPKPNREQPGSTPEPSKPKSGEEKPDKADEGVDEQDKGEKDKKEEKEEKSEEDKAEPKQDPSPKSEETGTASEGENITKEEGSTGTLPPKPSWTVTR